jgi:hypothetical protein
MRRGLLFCGGILLAVAAEAILLNPADVYLRDDPWFSAEFTRIVGLGLIDQGAVAALGAALCLGRAFVPLKLSSRCLGASLLGNEAGHETEISSGIRDCLPASSTTKIR